MTPRQALKEAIAAVMGVRMTDDVYERLSDFHCGNALLLGSGRRIPLRVIRDRGLLFIHIPKNAGTSISTALYGMPISHRTIRYYQTFAPELFHHVKSFAVLRNPVDRFLSALEFGRRGGTEDVGTHPRFWADYARFKSVDWVLEYIERQIRRSPYQLDNPLRPQSWFVRGHDGEIAVDALFLLERFERVKEFLAAFGCREVGHANRTDRIVNELLPAQVSALQELYRDDFALVERVRSATRDCPAEKAPA